MELSKETKKLYWLQNNQLNNSYPYQYQQTSTGQNGNGVHSNGNGKVPYSELENGHVENYRRHHSNKMGVEYQGLLSPEETDSLLMERTMEVGCSCIKTYCRLKVKKL